MNHFIAFLIEFTFAFGFIPLFSFSAKNNFVLILAIALAGGFIDLTLKTALISLVFKNISPVITPEFLAIIFVRAAGFALLGRFFKSKSHVINLQMKGGEAYGQY